MSQERKSLDRNNSILFIAPMPPPVTGQSLACKVLLEGMVDSYDVRIVNFSKDTFKPGVSSLARVGEILLLLGRIFRSDKNADIIYYTISQSLAGNVKDVILYLLCYRHLDRMVIHLHGGAEMTKIFGVNTFLSFCNKMLIKKMGGAIVLGKSQVNIFSSFLSHEKIHMVPNFAEDYLFAKKLEITEKFSNLSPLRVIFLSNLIPGKGHGELLAAFSMLQPSEKKLITIDFAGGFDSDRDRRDFLDRISGIEQIRYHGIVHGDEKRKLLLQSHVFCLPTYYRYEGQPISILEAYASGCAVITTNHSGIPDIFTDTENGFMTKKRSVADLHMVLQKILVEKGSLLKMARANHEIANERFRVSLYRSNIKTIFDKVVRAPSDTVKAVATP